MGQMRTSLDDLVQILTKFNHDLLTEIVHHILEMEE